MKFLTKSLLMFALLLTMNLNIQAQESAPTLAIEEIIVTARKKEESFKMFLWQLLLLLIN